MIVGLGRGGGLGCGGLRCRGCVRGFRRVGGARHSSVGIFHHLSRNRAADGIAVEFQRSEDEFDVRFVGFARGYGARDCAGEVRGAAFAGLTYAFPITAAVVCVPKAVPPTLGETLQPPVAMRSNTQREDLREQQPCPNRRPHDHTVRNERRR